ncbi:MAG: 1-acyl-sn-glycerol-3-phosphate acyltransferase [Kiritimatiellaceae bacterium]|nr:1-acyl-sn-glycerol-3-phosphate acyltransferase [Kiritimatiellaceae bacterium]
MFYRLQTILLNLTFYLLFFAVAAVLVPILVVYGCVLVPFCSWRRTLKRIRALIRVYGITMIHLGWPFIRIRTEWADEPPPEPCIYICNHRATSDGFLMGMLGCEGVQVVNIWPFKIPVLGVFARLAGYLSIREMPAEEFMQQGTRLLDDGVSIIAFPEGTRSGSRQMGPFHGALFRLALRSGAPIVPLCLSGTEDKPTKGSVIMKPGLIRMRFMPPITADVYQEMSPFKLKNHVRNCMISELEQMEQEE